jgi:hypothetical protein
VGEVRNINCRGVETSHPTYGRRFRPTALFATITAAVKFTLHWHLDMWDNLRKPSFLLDLSVHEASP